jgi:hypothetical protein
MEKMQNFLKGKAGISVNNSITFIFLIFKNHNSNLKTYFPWLSFK